MNDMESLEKALDGAYAMFLTTHYWEERNKEKEIVRGLNAIYAAVKQNVKHIILNGYESVRKLIGKECNNLDSKAAKEKYLKEVGKWLPGPSSSLRESFTLSTPLTVLVIKDAEHAFREDDGAFGSSVVKGSYAFKAYS